MRKFSVLIIIEPRGLNMDDEFINITTENVFNEHLCCIIRSKKFHPGIDAKRQWLSKRLNEGHVFRKLNERGTIFIEYAPLEKAWVPIVGDNYFYIYCLWVMGSYKGKGYGKSLMNIVWRMLKQKENQVSATRFKKTKTLAYRSVIC